MFACMLSVSSSSALERNFSATQFDCHFEVMSVQEYVQLVFSPLETNVRLGEGMFQQAHSIMIKMR